MPDENVITPADSPWLREFIGHDDPEETYIDLDDDFIDECMNVESSADANAIRNLIQRRDVNYKLSPDSKFATSPINIRDKDYDFLWIYLSYLFLRKALFVVLKMKVL